MFGLQGSGVYAKKKQFAGSKGPQGLYKIWGVGNANAGGDIGLRAIQEVASDPTLRKALTDLQQNWSRIFPHLGSIDPQCMVHGDFHHWNNLFGEREDDVMLIDWQYFGAGRPMYELVHFLNSGVDVTTVRDDEELLQAYYEALVDPASSFPVPQLTYDELMRHYKLAVVDGAVSMCISLGTSTMGVSYTPKDYMNMAKCPKQRDFVCDCCCFFFFNGCCVCRLVALCSQTSHTDDETHTTPLTGCWRHASLQAPVPEVDGAVRTLWLVYSRDGNVQLPSC